MAESISKRTQHKKFADATRLSLSRRTRSTCLSARQRQAASQLLANEENAVMVLQESPRRVNLTTPSTPVKAYRLYLFIGPVTPLS